eukprot:tig00001025_g6364.t1
MAHAFCAAFRRQAAGGDLPADAEAAAAAAPLKYRGAGIARDVFEGAEKSERMKADLRAAVGAREPELRAAFRADSLARCRSGAVKWFLLRALEREFRGRRRGPAGARGVRRSSVPALARAFEAATASALPRHRARPPRGRGPAAAVALRVGGKRCLAVRRRTREAGPPDAAGAQA